MRISVFIVLCAGMNGGMKILTINKYLIINGSRGMSTAKGCIHPFAYAKLEHNDTKSTVAKCKGFDEPGDCDVLKTQYDVFILRMVILNIELQSKMF